jgi:hypothetical protein
MEDRYKAERSKVINSNLQLSYAMALEYVKRIRSTQEGKMCDTKSRYSDYKGIRLNVCRLRPSLPTSSERASLYRPIRGSTCAHSTQ